MPIRLNMEVIKVEGKGWWVCVELGLNICDKRVTMYKNKNL